MKQKQFDKRNLKASASLNRFDLSNRTILSAPFGMLVPCMVRHLVGKSKVRIELEHQIRVNALNAPAFSRIRQHFDYFFVPYSQLYRYYDNFKTQQSNYNSSLFQNQDIEIPLSLPFFDGQDMSTLANPNAEDKGDDLLGYNLAYGHRRLFDLLRYGNLPSSGYIGSFPYLNPSIRLNPFAGLAYQKIYYDYYRNDKYEDNDSQAYNIDDCPDGSHIDLERLRKIFQIRYRWRRKDYFTQVTPDVLPSSNLFGFKGFQDSLKIQGFESIDNNEFWRQFSLPGSRPYDTTINEVSSLNKHPEDVDNLDLNTLRSNTVGSGVRFSSNTPKQGGNSIAYLSQTVTNLQQQVSQHRLAVARQQLLERMYSAHSDFSSQMLAIWGYAPTEGRFGNVKHIGGFSDVVQIADVDNSTPTRSEGTAVFGKINNVNSHQRYIDYDVPEDGILMCIFSTDILQDYDSYRLDRFNFKNVPEDFFNPYYQNLGKQALYSVEYATVAWDSENNDYVPTTPCVVGFVPRYSEYKTQIDEVHGEFCQWGTKNYMVAPTNLDYETLHPYLYIRNLVLNPKQLDPILPFDFNGTEETDCFDLNLYHSVKLLAPFEKLKL